MLESSSNQLNMNNYAINMISAGLETDLEEIKNNFSNINYLIFRHSTFPFTASLYCE